MRSAYFNGRRMLAELRRVIAERRGDEFDERVFHDELIRSGAPPGPLLERELK